MGETSYLFIDFSCLLSAVMERQRSSLSRDALPVFYKLYVRAHLENAAISWCNIPVHLSNRLVLGYSLWESVSHHELSSSSSWRKFSSRRQLSFARMGHSLQYKLMPLHILKAAGELCPLVLAFIVTACSKHTALQHPNHGHPLFKIPLCS